MLFLRELNMKNRFSGSAFFDSQMPFVAADNFFAQT
jgi:hypothetical protein